MSRRRFAPMLLALIVALGLLPLSPASAARNRPPRIKKAVMKDTDGDGKANKVVLTYNERINHRLDTSRFPFKVQGYAIKKVNAARRSTKLHIVLKESASAPLKPASIRYTRTRKQPVKDLKKLQAAKQLLTRNIIGLAATTPPPPPPGTHTLRIEKTGSGAGTVTSTSSPTQANQINCGATCVTDFASGTTVTLTAAADDAAGAVFAGWSGGGCTGLSTTCNVTMDAAKTVTATFDKPGSFLLTVTKSGGTGTVTSTSSPTQTAQINCGASCTASYPATTQVTLTAAPDTATNMTFAGWSGGGCTGTSTTCTITMDGAKTVTATFGAATQRSLTVTKAGTGTGTVTSTSTPAQTSQVDCGPTCQVNYPDQSRVTLTAAANPDSDFAGWSGGGCTGTQATCNVTMDAAKTVTATFNLKAAPGTFALTVTPTLGTVTCVPQATGGANGCNGNYAANTSVTITAVPTPLEADPLSVEWTGCASNPTPLTCTVTMDANKTVTVSFDPVGLPDTGGLPLP